MHTLFFNNVSGSRLLLLNSQQQLQPKFPCYGFQLLIYVVSMANDVVLELALQCSDLQYACSRTGPSTMLSVQHAREESGFWNQHFQTEVVTETAEPCYLETIVFLSSDGIDHDTKLRFVVYKVKNLKSSAVEELGSCFCFVQDLVKEQRSFTFHLQNKGNYAGCLHLAVLKQSIGQQQVKKNKAGKTIVPLDDSLASGMTSRADRVRQFGTLRTCPVMESMYVLDSTVSRTYRFPLQGDQDNFRAQENMLETRASIRVPILFLKLCIEYEEKKVAGLQALGNLPGRWDALRKRKLAVHKKYIERYQDRLKFLLEYVETSNFKKSTDKTVYKLDFVPINLHLQQLRVENVSSSPSSPPSHDAPETSPAHTLGSPSTSGKKSWNEYNFITVGATAIHSMGFKHGGLLVQLINAEEGGKGKKGLPMHSIGRCLKRGRSMVDDDELLLNISSLREQIKYQIEKLRILIEPKSTSAVYSADNVTSSNETLVALGDKVSKLVSLCDCTSVSTRVVDLAISRPPITPGSPTTPDHPSTSSALPSEEVVVPGGADVTLISLNGEIHSDSPYEHWENKVLSVNSNLSDVVKCVHPIISPEDLLILQEPLPSQYEVAGSSLSALQSSIDVLCDDVKAAVTFADLKVQADEVDPELLYRRNAVFSQALSLCVAGVSTLICSSLHDQLILNQFKEVGVFLQVESLLSTYGSELGMLQDYAVGIFDLANVVFKCVQASRQAIKTHLTNGASSNDKYPKYLPTINGNLDSLTVLLPFDDDSFSLLPSELQRGKLIKVYPVIFNVGINEEQTLAEKFGNTSLQEYLNMESMKRTLEYYDLVRDRCPTSIPERLRNAHSFLREISQEKTPSPSKKAPSGGINTNDVQRPIMDLITSLRAAVNSKKSKHVEILQLAADICRRMNGIRVTSCKSAKDRTAMAVTLEQARVLVNVQGMATTMFTQALSCMRSQGTRRENTLKNTGSRRYAFTSVQLLTFPKLYRAPEGTYGKGET